MNEQPVLDEMLDRVNQFTMLRLPGQAQFMHMGTSYLVNDLADAVRRLREQLANAEAERKAWQREAAMLLEACEEVLWLIDGMEDIDDGSDGQPVPNVFMKIGSVLKEATAKATKP